MYPGVVMLKMTNFSSVDFWLDLVYSVIDANGGHLLVIVLSEDNPNFKKYNLTRKTFLMLFTMKRFYAVFFLFLLQEDGLYCYVMAEDSMLLYNDNKFNTHIRKHYLFYLSI